VHYQIRDIQTGEFDLSLGTMRIVNMSRILQVEKSMRLHGQLQPVVGRAHEGGIQLIDGFKRLYAAENLLIESLQCHLLEVDQEQAKVLLLSYNWSNRSLEPYEEGLVLQDLLQTHDMAQRELSRLTGKSTSWVSRRLSLIGRLDEEICADIRMGVLTSSHARALMRLPRGNQIAVARVIRSHNLTSRQSERIVDAYLEAEDVQSQQQLLANPEKVLYRPALNNPQEQVYDPRLSGYGNQLATATQGLITGMQELLKLLEDPRIKSLHHSEQELIFPAGEIIHDGALTVKQTIGNLQSIKHKTQQNTQQ
jgi:ParB family chromosome partitioning protein